jgi:hypothetical protein
MLEYTDVECPFWSLTMTIPLPEQLRAVLAAHPEDPLQLLDEETNTVYVLVPASRLDLRHLVDDDLAATYPAQMESAMRAGWDDPAMDDYNNYDAHRAGP